MFVYLSIWNSAVNGIVITLKKERGRILEGARVQTGARIHPAFL
jgi:hypothetical protein